MDKYTGLLLWLALLILSFIKVYSADPSGIGEDDIIIDIHVPSPPLLPTRTITPSPEEVDDDIEYVSTVAFATYLSGNNDRQSSRIKPYLIQLVREESYHGSINIDTQEGAQKLKDIIIKAVGLAIDEQQKELDQKWSKKQSALLAAASSIITALITSGTAMIISYSTSDC